MRSSGGVSMRMRVPTSVSTTAPTLVRRSRGSGERHTAHPQPSCGTPKEVPVPRKVSFTTREEEGGRGKGGIWKGRATGAPSESLLPPSSFLFPPLHRLHLDH